MKKYPLVAIPILVILALAISLIALDQRQTPAWKSVLDQYLQFVQASDKSSYQVLSAATARMPGQFTADMSAGSFSNSGIFESYTSNEDYVANLQPMPFPPVQVVCVLLGDSGEQQLVYVALHSNLYNDDWIVHISPDPWGSPASQSALDSLGCYLGT